MVWWLITSVVGAMLDRERLITSVVSAVSDLARWYSHESCGVQQIPSLSNFPRHLYGALVQLGQVVQLVWMGKREKVVTLGHTLPLLLSDHCVPMFGSVQSNATPLRLKPRFAPGQTLHLVAHG